MATDVDDWESVVAARSRRRTERRVRSQAMVAALLVAACLAAIGLAVRDEPSANAAHAAVLDAPPMRFVAELRGPGGPSDRATGALDFGRGIGLVESRRTNGSGVGWEETTFPTVGWEQNRIMYVREGEVRSLTFGGERVLFFLEQLMASTPALLAEADRVLDGRDQYGVGPLQARVSAGDSQRLGISSKPLTISLDMSGDRIEEMRIQWESILQPGEFVSLSVDFGARASAADLDRAISSNARADAPAE